MLSAIAFGLIPVFIVMGILSAILLIYFLEDEENAAGYIFVSLIPSAVIALVVVRVGSVTNTGPAEPITALGLSVGTAVTFVLFNIVIGTLLFLRSRADMQLQVEARLEEMLRKKAKETNEILKKHGL